MTTNQTIDGVPVFYAIDPLDAYPEPVGTDDKIERSNGALWVHLNGKRSKLIGLQSLDFLINQLVQIKGEVFGNEPAAQPQGEPVAWRYHDEAGISSWFDGTPEQVNLEFVEQRGGRVERAYAEQPAPVANTWPKLSFMAIAAGEHAHADYCQKHAYGSLNEYRNHEALTHAIEVAVAYDKLNSKPAPVAVLMPTQEDFERFIIRRDGSVNVSVLGNSRFYNDATIDSEYFVWLTCLDEVTQLNAKSR